MAGDAEDRRRHTSCTEQRRSYARDARGTIVEGDGDERPLEAPGAQRVGEAETVTAVASDSPMHSTWAAKSAESMQRGGGPGSIA